MTDERPDIELKGVDTIKPGDIERLSVGDRFVATTYTRYEARHMGPEWSKGRSADPVIENPLGVHPDWLSVPRGERGTTYYLELDEYYNNSKGKCKILDTLEDDDEPPEWMERTRDEPVVWDGTPQSVSKPLHNKIINEDDIRGNKNDNLRGMR